MMNFLKEQKRLKENEKQIGGRKRNKKRERETECEKKGRCCKQFAQVWKNENRFLSWKSSVISMTKVRV